MPKIKPPRKPRGEPSKVTIANQDRQIMTLIGRTEALLKQVGSLIIERDALKQSYHRTVDEKDGMVRMIEEYKDRAIYSDGYIARVKETDKHMYGEFPIGSAG